MEFAGVVLLYEAFRDQVLAYLMALPRAYAFLIASQLLNPQVMPRIARNVVIMVLTAPLVPGLQAEAQVFTADVPSFMVYFAKEVAIGVVLGYLVFWMFWAIQAAGTYIDNQRGTAIASSIDPLQGHEASPMGLLFSQAFVTYFFALGGFLVVLGLLYESYAQWPVDRLLPIGRDASFPALMLEILDRGTMLAILLSAPVVVIMFLAEFALAMISRFAPQIQVFILAMPIKSAIAMLILLFYLPIMMDHAVGEQAMVEVFFDRFYEILRVGAERP
ncbi:EscT/YscT/HrcT family type III secretion system export apparatus protein [Tabrizicola sp. TH137]|uniref:type III secretion system export apparatus subunit SctT n=1 Tax=Tabrizicola sp. TH137 TaxID=2067452 RepID=UPI000C7B307D|nr:type III secretion system export apparatus subunit SctT [Tabrizicola sp. TH137]PLL11173.1 EscT/YscT/HrcT family type III secretion system export apparatus protein [Tabrizicola sp. TH137]